MFLHVLTEAQQKSFLAVARQFVEADSRLSDEEHNLVELMYAETGIGFDEELPSGSLEELLQGFDTRQARAVVVLELIGVGHADDHFCPSESALLTQIAGILQVPAADVAAMENWVQRQLQLARDVEKFWSD